MKMIISLLTIACLQISAKGLSQTVTFSGKDVPVTKVFAAIESQTGYVFFYDVALLREAKPVTIEVKNMQVETVLQLILKGQPIDFSIENRTVTIIKRQASPFEAGFVRQPPIDVTGRVVNETGEPIPGVSISVKRNNHSVLTNANGEFTLTDLNAADILIINSVAYETQEIRINNRNVLSITLIKKVNELDQTVVIGYGQTTKRANTGNIGRLTSEQIRKQPVANPLQAMQGRIAGVYIQQNTGVPGGGYNIQIRGVNSILLGSDPLYIVDGVTFPSSPLSSSISGSIVFRANPLNSINPADIESIEVLKDADATAIYGSRGGNGVVLITTKKAKQGKTKIDLNFYAGIGQLPKKLEVLNTPEYLEMRKEAFQNDAASLQSWDYDVNGVWDTTRNIDWQKELVGKTAKITDIQSSISAGSENVQLLVGSGYHKETTVFPGNFSNQRASVMLNLNCISTNRKFKSTISANYSVENNDLLNTDLSSYAISLPPNTPELKDAKGNPIFPDGIVANPYGELMRKYKSLTNNVIVNAVLSYEFSKTISLKSNFGYTRMDRDEIQTIPKKSYMPTTTSLPSSGFADNSLQTWLAEPQLNWEKKFNRNSISVLAGATFQQSIRQGQLLNALFSDDVLLENISAATSIKATDVSYAKYKYNSLFARIHYEWNREVIINLTGRRDGSSNFGPGNQFANFGSLGAAWIFTEGKIFRNYKKVINYGKLRASYGVSGNDQIGSYGYLDLWQPTQNPYSNLSGLSPVRITNPDYAWERIKKIEAGLEVGLFNNLAFLSFSYYQNKSDNQLVGFPVPPSTGFTTVQANLPAKLENKGWEFELLLNGIQNNKFRWQTSFNLSIPRNRLLEFPNIAISPYAYVYAEGKSLLTKYLLHYVGVDSQTGIWKFEDVNKNGNDKDSPADLLPTKKVGQDLFGGINNSFTYRRMKLDLFVQFVRQSGFNYLTAFPSPPGFLGNQPKIVLNRWQKQGDESNIQRYTQTYGNEYLAYLYGQILGDNRISDASFIRLKNISFSYNITPNKTDKLFKSIIAYIQGQNLFTITKYLGNDPESQNVGGVSPLRVITVGVSLTL